MPYKSDAQRRYFNANRAELETQGVDVKEWNESSRGKRLPVKIGKKKKHKKVSTTRAPGNPMSLAAFDVAVGVKRALWSIVDQQTGDLSVVGGVIAGEMQSRRVVRQPPVIAPGQVEKSAEAFDAVRVALAVRRGDDLIKGPARALWLQRRQAITKQGYAPAVQQPVSVNTDPTTAYSQLMSMMRPAPVPRAGQGLPTSQPGGEMPGRNTPTTNPIGLLSGLGVDPGGSSVMGNAAFGTKNAVAMLKRAVGRHAGFGPLGQHSQDYYATQRARNSRSAPQPAARSPRPPREVHVGNRTLSPEETKQWDQLNYAGRQRMAAQLRAADTPPEGMTPSQAAQWEARKDEPGWAARAKQWLAANPTPAPAAGPAPAPPSPAVAASAGGSSPPAPAPPPPQPPPPVQSAAAAGAGFARAPASTAAPPQATPSSPMSIPRSLSLGRPAPQLPRLPQPPPAGNPGQPSQSWFSSLFNRAGPAATPALSPAATGAMRQSPMPPAPGLSPAVMGITRQSPMPAVGSQSALPALTPAATGAMRQSPMPSVGSQSAAPGMSAASSTPSSGGGLSKSGATAFGAAAAQSPAGQPQAAPAAQPQSAPAVAGQAAPAAAGQPAPAAVGPSSGAVAGQPAPVAAGQAAINRQLAQTPKPAPNRAAASTSPLPSVLGGTPL